MEKANGRVTEVPGSRLARIKMAFLMGTRALLTSCSKEEFYKLFPSFSPAELQRLHQLFIQVISSVPEDIEEGFESFCEEMQVGPTLDMVEQLVEEQSLDPLFPEKSNVEEVAHYLSEAKENEINYLTSMLEKAEEEKRAIISRVEVLKKEGHDISGTKIWTGYQRYGSVKRLYPDN